MGGVLSAVNTLELIKRKDKDEVFIDAHTAEIDSILLAGGALATVYFEDGQAARADKLLADLITLKPMPEFYYLAGRMAQAAMNDDLAIHYYNTASAKIYREIKAGREADAKFLPMFIALANAIGKQGDLISAFNVYNRTIKLFPYVEASDSCYAFISSAVYRYGDQTDTVKMQQIISYLDTIPPQMPNILQFKILKWECILAQYAQLKDLSAYGYDLQPNAYLIQWACKDNYASAADIIFQAVQRETVLKFSATGISVTRSPEQFSDWITLLTCLNGGNVQQAEAKVFSLVDDAITQQNFTLAGQLIYNMAGVASYATAAKNYEKKLFTGLQNLPSDDLDAIDLYALSIMFPGNTTGKKLQKDESIKQITGLIKKGDYTTAGNKLRAQMLLDPKDATIRTLYKTWIVQDYLNTYTSSATYMDLNAWNGSVDNCQPGTLPDSVHAKVLTRLNYFRRLAGVPDNCVFSKELNAHCQAAALMMTANNDLSHGPPKDWKCFINEGAIGAGNSNLSLGYGGSEALTGQVEDDGGNNGGVGHRRWILFPYRRVYGHGSTDNAMALWALGGQNTNEPEEIWSKYTSAYVAWPPEWFCPAPLAPGRWSLSRYDADFSEATVQMFQNGKEIEVEVLPVEYGYGLPTLVWEIGFNYFGLQPDETFKVVVKKIIVENTWNEEKQAYNKTYEDHTYTVSFVSIY
jgi:hypothetical protein